MNSKIKELIDRQQDLKFELKDIQSKLCTEVERYEGSLREALRDGIVRLNFPAPSGFYKYLKGE